ncbi:MAG: RNB domain-containing ribonuclease, partial [Patescibacteria group bacterium]
PLKVIKKIRGDSNKLIEEFMLLANKKVAELFSAKVDKTEKDNGVFIYRIHDRPEKEKVINLAFFLRSLGHKISIINDQIPKQEINKILQKISGQNGEDTIRKMIIRSMAKAIYSTKNIGHYGLAFDYYAHFTSPIRRYPDMVAHRLLADFLKTESKHQKANKEKVAEFQKIAMRSSEREKYAADAERASVKYKQVEYMSLRIGKTFSGTISGVTEWGMFVEEHETKCEGLVRLREMKDDFYIFI